MDPDLCQHIAFAMIFVDRMQCGAVQGIQYCLWVYGIVSGLFEIGFSCASNQFSDSRLSNSPIQ